MKITIELTTIGQVLGIEAALELFVDMETDRSKDKDSGFTPADKQKLDGARSALKLIREGK